jgi:mRNA interferase MazF
MRAGELYLVDFGPPSRGVEQANVRPAIVIHSDDFMRIPNLAVICPITKADRRVPNHVAIPPSAASGLRHPSFVMTEQIRAVDLRFVGVQLGSAPRDVTNTVLRILRERILAVRAT